MLVPYKVQKSCNTKPDSDPFYNEKKLIFDPV